MTRCQESFTNSQLRTSTPDMLYPRIHETLVFEHRGTAGPR